MRSIIFYQKLFFFLFSIVSGNAQQLSYSVQEGNVFVYKNARLPNQLKIEVTKNDLLHLFQRSRDTVQVFQVSQDRMNGATIRTISSNGMLVESDYGSEWRELFPLTVPRIDTFYLYIVKIVKTDSVRCVVKRQFDTTLFNRPVIAFTFQTLRPDYGQQNIERTIASEFGLIREVRSANGYPDTDIIYLHSCLIKGEGFNWETRRWRFLQLCVGNEYNYTFAGWDENNKYFEHLESYKIQKMTTFKGNNYFDRTFFGLIRESNDTLINILTYPEQKESILLHPNATIGSIVGEVGIPGRWGVVVDTGSIEYAGKQRRKLTVVMSPTIVELSEYKQTWVEGIGLLTKDEFGNPAPVGYWLSSYRICFINPVEKINSYEKIIQLSQNFPNPFSTSTAITYQISTRDHVRLEVFDMLGRKVATIVDEQKDAGVHDVRFSAGQLQAGIYLYRLLSDGNSITRKMLVTQ